MSTEFNIGFDNSHFNKLIIEDPGFNDFIEFLFNSDLKLGKIEAGITYEKLSAYNIFIIGVPTSNYKLDSNEIEDLVKYVKDGGSLLIINDKGGEYENKNNLNELTQYFGVQFNSDQLFDNEDFSKDISRPIIKNFKKHFITKDITQFIHSGGCTLNIDKSVETDEVDVMGIAFSSKDSSWHKYYNLDQEDWVDEPVSKAAIIAVTHFGLGKVAIIGNLSLFSSFHDMYGIHAADNFRLISNIISWLLNKAHSKEAQLIQPIYTTIPIKQDLFYWIKEKLDDGTWKSIEEAINFALNVVKIRMTKEETKQD